MKLFNLFRRNVKLADLLEKAIKNPAFRIDFYKRILNEPLVVVVDKNERRGLGVITLPDGRIPVFTAKERIFDNGVITEPVAFASINAKELFEAAKGASFVLNPYSQYNKELVPEEIEHILAGNIAALEGADKITVRENVIIGQPADYPAEMTAALKEFFSHCRDVQRAYIGWIYNLDTKEPPHYIIGIQMRGDIDKVNYEAGRIASRFLSKEEFVDFINMDGGGKIVNYLKSTEPFFDGVK